MQVSGIYTNFLRYANLEGFRRAGHLPIKLLLFIVFTSRKLLQYIVTLSAQAWLITYLLISIQGSKVSR